MTIERLQKATVAGVVAQKGQILDALQSFGGLHLIDLSTGHGDEEDDGSLAPVQYQQALHYLEDCPERRSQVLEAAEFAPQQVAGEVLALQAQVRELRDRQDFLGKRIAELKPWGSFHLPADTLYGQRLWFYLVPNFKLSALDGLELPWHCVHRDNRFSYVAVVAEDEPDSKLLPVPRSHTGSVPLATLQHEYRDIQMQLEDLAAERHSLTRWIYLLQRSLAAVEDHAARELAELMALDNDQVFALQGWVSESQLDALRQVAGQHSLALVIEAPGEDDRPPTLLENPDSLAGGEEIVRFYQMPGYRAWDPSRVVFFSFALFFALILSDAGYAALMGLLVLGYWNKLGVTQTGRRLRALGATLALTSLAYGVLVGSYFGAQAPVAPLAALQILDINNFDQMMKVSVVVGVLHVVLANLIAAWQHRRQTVALAALGWVMMLLAGLLWWLAGVSLLSNGGLAVGAALVFLFSSDRGFGSGKVWLWRCFDGFIALTGISKLFGDVLSYLRLFALGLASASLALTFNQLAVDVGQMGGGLGVLLQALILLIGHLLNFVLAIVSGVIHGLRLNLIEFYNWSLSDEGYAFQPFAKKEVNPWTT